MHNNKIISLIKESDIKLLKSNNYHFCECALNDDCGNK